MPTDTGKISVLELRRLLVELKEHRPDICIRCRPLGQMWAPNFAAIVALTEKGVLMKDDPTGRIINIPDLSQIVQFELDKPFQSFQPYFHYEVTTVETW